MILPVFWMSCQADQDAVGEGEMTQGPLRHAAREPREVVPCCFSERQPRFAAPSGFARRAACAFSPMSHPSASDKSSNAAYCSLLSAGTYSLLPSTLSSAAAFRFLNLSLSGARSFVMQI